MKKIFAVAASLILVVVSANSQSEKKEPPPPPKEPPKVEITKFPPPPASAGIASQKEFLKKNSTVANINWQSGKPKTIILKLKSGDEEKFDLTSEAEEKKFTGKYGVPPVQPPPPPKQKTKA